MAVSFCEAAGFYVVAALLPDTIWSMFYSVVRLKPQLQSLLQSSDVGTLTSRESTGSLLLDGQVQELKCVNNTMYLVFGQCASKCLQQEA